MLDQTDSRALCFSSNNTQVSFAPPNTLLTPASSSLTPPKSPYCHRLLQTASSRLSSYPTHSSRDPQHRTHFHSPTKHTRLITWTVVHLFSVCYHIARAHDMVADTIPAEHASALNEYYQAASRLAAENFQKIPGSAIVARYVASSYQNDPIRSLLELFLVLFALRTVLQSRTRGRCQRQELRQSQRQGNR